MKLLGLEKIKKTLKTAILSGLPSLLVGETGTGKTSLIKEIAEELGRPLVRVNLHGLTTPDQLIGRYQARSNNGNPETYFERGCLHKAVKDGAILLLDEINSALPDTLFLLFPLLEDNPRLYTPELDEDMTPSPGFAICATMNPTNGYSGTRDLNEALKSRFAVHAFFEPLKGAKLLKCLSEYAESFDLKISGKNLSDLVKLLETAQKFIAEDKIESRISLREGIRVLKLMSLGLNFEDALEFAFWTKLSPDEMSLFDRVPRADQFDYSIDELIEKAKERDAMEKRLLEAEEKLKASEEIKAAIEVRVKAKKSASKIAEELAGKP